MSIFTVKLQPDGQQFITTSKQDVLQSALAAGLNLSHGCSNGQCGRCIARLAEGELLRLKHSDYPLTPSQRDSGYFLTCCHAAVTDLQVEVDTVSSALEIPEQTIETRVYRLQKLSDDVMAVTLKTPRTTNLEFLAGQYITVSLNADLQRNKSLASCPCDGLRPEIHVRRRTGDAFSEYVFQRLKKNDRVTLNGPWGDFTAVEDSDLPLLLIAFDTGFASIKSLLEHFIAQEKEQPIRLFWLTTAQSSPYMDNYCRSLADALDNFSFKTLRPSAQTFEAVVAALGGILEQTEKQQPQLVYATFPHECLDKVQHWFLQQGVDEERLFVDRIEWFGWNGTQQCLW